MREREHSRSRDKNYKSNQQQRKQKQHRQKEHNRDEHRDKDRNNDRPRYRRQRQPTLNKNQSYEYIGQPVQKINRAEICPFLVRIYYCINGTNRVEKVQDLPKQRQIILYLWMSSTLKEITQLLRAHLSQIRTKQRFQFRRIWIDYDDDSGDVDGGGDGMGGKLKRQEMGTVMEHKRGFENLDVQLQDQKFCIGDYIDVSINYK